MENTTPPWLSKVMFCSGFIVGFSLCFFTICHLRVIPSSHWHCCLTTLCSAPAADSDPAPTATGPSDNASVPAGRLLCWVVANQKVSCSRTFQGCAGIMLLVRSPRDPDVPGVLEKEKKLDKSMAAFRTFQRSVANDACVVVEELRWTLAHFRRHPALFLGWALRTCGRRGYTLSWHVALRLVEALRNHSSLEFVQVACCPETHAGDADSQGGPGSFHTL